MLEPVALAALCALGLYRCLFSNGRHWLAETVVLALFYLALTAISPDFSDMAQTGMRLSFLALSFVPFAGILSFLLPVFIGGKFGICLSAAAFLLVFRSRQSAAIVLLPLAFFASESIGWGLLVSADLNRALIFAATAGLLLCLSAVLFAIAVALKERLSASLSRGPR